MKKHMATRSDHADLSDFYSSAYRQLFNCMQDEVHVWEIIKNKSGEIENWRLVDINPKAEEVWSKSTKVKGNSAANWIGKTADEIFETALQQFLPIVRKIFSENQPYTWELFFDDTNQFLKMTSIPFGERFISTGSDISILKNAIESAEASDTAKSDFLATMSHEFRTPLNAVIGFADTLKLGVHGELATKQLELASHISEAGSQMLRIVDDILNFASFGKNQTEIVLEECDAVSLIQSPIKWAKENCDKRSITLSFQAESATDTLIQTDPDRLSQVVSNLINNAEKFSAEGSTILIEVQNIDEGFLRIFVSDEGVGIKKEAHAGIFNIFNRGELSPKVAVAGTGIGLTLSKSLIELLGGWIDFVSSPGVGSKFWVSVPLSSNQDVLIWSSNLRTGVSDIDDDHRIIFMLINMLSRPGLQNPELENIVKKIISYTQFNFQREAVLMRVGGLPDLDEHVAQHQNVLDMITGLADQWKSNRKLANLKKMQHFLVNWWRQHISERDTFLQAIVKGNEKEIKKQLHAKGLADFEYWDKQS